MIAGFVLVRLCLMFPLGLGVDESYALAIGRDGLSLSYFDHPPLHVWLAHFSEGVFGDARLARLPFVLLSAGTSWFMYRLAAQLFGVRAGLWALFALNLTIYFGVVSGGWVLPDGPLNLFLLAAAVAFVPVLKGGEKERTSWARWARIGLCIGLAALSKYHAAFFGLGLLGFIAATPRLRHLFARPEPYVGAAVALLLVSPVLIWNAQHHWVSFAFQGGRAGAAHGGLRFDAPLTQLAGQLLLLSPWVFFPLGYAAIAAARAPDSAKQFCLWLGAPVVLFFTLSALWSGHGMIHWSMPGWLLLVPLLGDFLARRTLTQAWPRRWAVASLVLFLTITAAASAATATGWLGGAFPGLFPKGDPTVETASWDPLRDALSDGDFLGRPQLFVTAFNWRDGAKIDQALGGAMDVAVFSEDPRGFAFMPRSAPRLGEDSLIVVRDSKVAADIPRLRGVYESLRALSPVVIGRQGRREMVLRVFYAHKLLVPYPAAYAIR